MKERTDIKIGSLICKNNSYYLILDIKENTHVQKGFDGYRSTQSRNEPKEKVFKVWDGKFCNDRSSNDFLTGDYNVYGFDHKAMEKVLNLIKQNYE